MVIKLGPQVTGKMLDMSGANLQGADLVGANLQRVNLQRANLSEADLRWANLRGADLLEADLRWADLQGAILTEADLLRADLRGATLPSGESWETYLLHTVPAYLKAGGRSIKQIVESGCWKCHTWGDCPSSVAFGTSTPEGVPILLWPQRDLFVMFFDAGLIPCPTISD